MAAIFCVLTQIADMALMVSQKDASFVDGEEIHESVNDLHFVLKNSLSTVATFVLTVYNIHYTFQVMRQSQGGVFTQKVRSKIWLQAVTIEVVLILRMLFVWIHNQIWRTNQAWIWPSFLFLYEVLSEVNPFLIFCYTLWRQITYFNQLVERNEHLSGKQRDQQSLPP